MFGAFGIDVDLQAWHPLEHSYQEKLETTSEKSAKQFFEQRLLARENI